MKAATKTPVYAVLYAKMAEAARSCGYALAVHGTMGRDLDVVAIPWTEEATDPEEMVRAMAAVAARRVGNDPVIGYQPDGTPRPHGRVGYSFPFVSTDGFTPDGYVDISVVPRAPGASPSAREEGLRARVEALETELRETLDWFEGVGALPEDGPDAVGVYDWRDDEGALAVIDGLRRALASAPDSGSDTGAGEGGGRGE